ncbi:AAA family ATPase [Mycobacterium sp. 1274756.6]|uniref:bifunctional aminoglycoside phosphotransferase/ATP-binding protein n=1 Tax=Mycobacterium sp. 1274756.6 TaxID=1834076 RepID=UPI000A498F36|nr:AAA family ATPase [Mycobacterium sp. 1274756.6]
MTAAADSGPGGSASHRPPQIHETHSGIVVLVGDRAYKAKKPVTTEFLDFSTVDKRERVCAREVELNRRLSPSSYLGVAHLSGPDGGPAEPVIVMRRHPDSARLAAIVSAGEPADDLLDAIAGALAGFHDSAERGPAIDRQGTVAAVRARWHANLSELDPFSGEVVAPELLAEIAALADRYLDGRTTLFERRIADGRIVDGHGDLLTDDIFCLPDGIEILDCLEFDDTLRHVDVIDDIAFLAMDLEFLGRRDLSDVLLQRYRSHSGDRSPQSLAGFYVAYRALVRAKTDCVRFGQSHAGSRSAAHAHLEIAAARLRAATVRLTLVGGGPGTGKTTLARLLADRVGARVISTDEVRKDLVGQGRIAGAAGARDAGLYEQGQVAAVYDEMLRQARGLLSAGVAVILDGTWRDPAQRDRARRLSAESHAALIELHCVAAADVAAQRVAGRQSDHPSDATAELARQLAVDDWADAHRIDTGGRVEDAVAAAEQCWHRAVSRGSR